MANCFKAGKDLELIFFSSWQRFCLPSTLWTPSMIFVKESQAQNLINQWLKQYKHMPLSSRLKFALYNHNSGLNIGAHDNLQDREKKCPVRPSLRQRKEMLCDQRVWSKPLSLMFYRKRIWCPCKIIFQTGADIIMSNADHCWHISLS